MPLKESCITLLANHLCSFFLGKNFSSIRKRTPSNKAVCDDDRHRLLTLRFLFFSYLDLHQYPSTFVRASFRVTWECSGRTAIEVVNVCTSSNNWPPPRHRILSASLLLLLVSSPSKLKIVAASAIVHGSARGATWKCNCNIAVPVVIPLRCIRLFRWLVTAELHCWALFAPPSLALELVNERLAPSK